MAAVRNVVLKLFHLLAAIHFIYAVYYEIVHILPEEIPLRGYSFGGKFVYLTILNVFIQITYYTVAFVNDWIGTNAKDFQERPLIRRFKDFVFASLAFPLSITVSFLFWSLYAVDRELVYPKILESFHPRLLNHAVHTFIAVFILIEMLFLHRPYPTRKSGNLALMTFMVSYLFWILFVRYHAGKWVYPVLTELNVPGKIVFLAFVTAVPHVFYFFGEWLNSKIWNAKRLRREEEEDVNNRDVLQQLA